MSCGRGVETSQNTPQQQPTESPRIEASPSPTASAIPNLQSEFLNDGRPTSDSPLAKFDFKNFTYPLPRGWQNPDDSDVTLKNGVLAPVSTTVTDDMDDEEKAAAKSERRIGMSYVTTRYMDVTGDGTDEAVVVLKVETAGSAIPQFVYIYDWKDDKPELIWFFRTGDRADGGLKSMNAANGQFVVELFGQDRFLLGATETGKITGDFEQLCCPTYFTRTYYKWNGKNFLMNPKRLTYLIADPNAPPEENLAEIVNNPKKAKK
ncbi:MAG: hypothetical protein ACREO5_01960 [Candidatus Binatia bacterium]